MNYYNEIKNKLIENENYSRIKDYSKERYKVQIYYEIGRILSEAGKCYGEGIIKKYAQQLSTELNKKYTTSLLYKIKQFYNIIEKVPTLSGKLSWSHWYEMLSIKSIDEISYYVMQCEIHNLDVRTLRNKIKNKEYERLDEQTKLKLINQEELTIQDNIKNPIIIYSNNQSSKLTEKDLQNIILENIPAFLEELGSNFSFIKNEYKIKLGDRYNYIDKNLKKITQDKTIGIIICKKDNHFIMEYCSDPRIISREYRLLSK